MNPLIEKYFLGELTDPEESTLEKLLTDSEETAWDFGQAAEEAYHRYGLPEPELPGGDGSGDPPSETRSWGWVVPLLGLFLLGGFVWWKIHTMSVPIQPEVPAVRPAPIEAPVKRVLKKAAPVIKHLVPETRVSQAPKGLPPEGETLKESGNNLKVVVKRETAGPATVRVVNSLGSVIRLLYSGTLQAGDWSFEWDGKAGDGRLVEPGKYRIEVETEGGEQSRDVDIH